MSVCYVRESGATPSVIHIDITGASDSQGRFSTPRNATVTLARDSGSAIATVAMAYLFTDAMNTLAVASMSSARRILENREVFDFQFTPGERESLAKI